MGDPITVRVRASPDLYAHEWSVSASDYMPEVENVAVLAVSEITKLSHMPL